MPTCGATWLMAPSSDMPSAAFASATHTAAYPSSSASRATSSEILAPNVCNPATLTA